MLAKKYRLNRAQINTIYKKGRGKNFEISGVKYLDNQVDYARFAIVIPKKAVKLAVSRNRLRRVMFDEINALIKDQKFAKNRDYIIRLYRDVPDEKKLRTQIGEIACDV